MALNLEDDYVHLASNGEGTVVPGGRAFWALPPEELARFGQGWLVSEFEFSQDWTSWEMHPHAEELVCLLSGEIEFIQQAPAGIASARLAGRGTVLVPRGTWHTVRALAPSRMLFVTMGGGTQHKPVVAA